MRRTIALATAIAAAMFGLASCANPTTALQGSSAVAGRASEIGPTPVMRASGAAGAPQVLIYSANYHANTVTEYGAYANGDVRPLHTIAGKHTLMDRPFSLAVDKAGYLYVDDFSYNTPHISVFAPGADGDATPVRTLTAKSFYGIHAFGICVDAGGYLYVADTYLRDVRVWAPGAGGDVAPVRTVTDPALSSPFGVTVDATGHLWVTDSFEGAILEFPPGANGTMFAGRRISGPATGMQTPVSIQVSSDRHIFVADVNGNFVDAFAPNASGNVPPAWRFSPIGPSTTGFALALYQGQLFVGLQHGKPNEYGIAAFKSTSNGPTNPLRLISGPDTGVEALSIAVH